MSQQLKDAIITFLRACFAAGVAAAVTYATNTNPFGTSGKEFGQGVLIAFITGVIVFAGTYLRNLNSQPVTPQGNGRLTAGPHLTRTKSWADYLPF